MTTTELFDTMPVSTIREIEERNAPDGIVDLTPEVVKQLRSAAMESGKLQPIIWGRLTKAGLEELFGLRQPKRDENGQPIEIANWRDGKNSWVAEYDLENRKIVDSNLKRLKSTVNDDRLVTTPQTFIFLQNGQCGSAKHRGFSIYLRMLSDPSYQPVVALSFGLANAFADVLDRQAQRRNKEIGERNQVIPQELLVDADGHPLPDADKLISTLNRELSTALKIVWMRGQGADIKASMPFGATEYGEMLARCPGIEPLIVRLAVAGKDSEGKDTKIVKTFGRANILAALVLAANTENPSKCMVHEGRRIYELPDQILMPSNDIVDAVMDIGARGMDDDPYGPVFAAWKNATNKHPQRKFGLLVNVIRDTMGQTELTELPPPVDPETGQPLPGAKVRKQWSCPMIDPKAPGFDPGVPKTGKDSPAYQWANFGGLDVGYLPKPTAS